MQRHHTVKRFVAKLPEDFQEVLMSTEMELQQGLTVPTLRKLVYLYTRGMQYYDLVHKNKFHQFYSDKLVSLLTRNDVEEFLDKNPINFDDKKDLDKLFSAQQKKKAAPSKAPKSPSPKRKKSENLKKRIKVSFLINIIKYFQMLYEEIRLLQ